MIKNNIVFFVSMMCFSLWQASASANTSAQNRPTGYPSESKQIHTAQAEQIAASETKKNVQITNTANQSAVDEVDVDALLNSSLEELTNIEVTSVSKKAEKQNEAAAAIYVITQEDIKRSGATALPELLRGVPGVAVSQSGSHDWTVTARGFNGQFANKLLVLIDGRTIYSPLFAGVIWDIQDVVLEDIERIEVIRGPGATLWGANAVNGVINIITKSAQNTQGTYASTTIGNEIKNISELRHGVKIGEDTYVRAYAKYRNYDEAERSNGTGANDGWVDARAGFRADSKIRDTSQLTLQGDLYSVDEDADYTFPDINALTLTGTATGRYSKGGNILGRWTEALSGESEVSLQLYVDNATTQTSFFNNDTTTVDSEFKHIWTGWDRQELVWGFGYRLIHDRNYAPSQQFSLSPQTRDDNLYSAFVQDKFEIVKDEFFITLGSKFEHNDYSGFEIQPSARFSWLINSHQTLWGSVSRAVHTPSRYTDDGKLDLLAIPAIPPGIPLPTLFQSAGNRNLDAEDLIAYELGYRIQPADNLSFDLAAFYNNYDNIFLDVINPADAYLASSGTYFVQPITTTNGNQAESYGVELAAKWNVYNNWQLAGTYSYLDLTLNDKSANGFTSAGRQPKHMFSVKSTYVFDNGLSLTNQLYYSGEMSTIAVDDYLRFDTVLNYPLTDNIDVKLVGQNLLDSAHKEFEPFFYTTSSEVQRSVFGSISFKF